MQALDLRGSGTSWALYHQGQQVGGPYTSRDNAIAAERGVIRRLNPSVAKFRCCSGCGRGFLATGNTHCPTCRKGRKRHG